MEHYEIIVRLARVFHILANYMSSYAGDLFLDFPRACDIASCGREPIVFVHKTHADLMDRYNYNGEDYASCVKECQRSLGLDFSIEIGEDIIWIRNYNLSDSQLRDLVTRLHDIPEYRVADSVRIGE